MTGLSAASGRSGRSSCSSERHHDLQGQLVRAALGLDDDAAILDRAQLPAVERVALGDPFAVGLIGRRMSARGRRLPA